MKHTRSAFFLFACLLLSSAASAAPRCLDLTREQATRAVSIMKIALYERSPILIYSKKETGFAMPTGVWAEKKKGLRGSRSYRVRMDGREVDISLLYVARNTSQYEAWNLAWLVGCRPAADKPMSIRR